MLVYGLDRDSLSLTATLLHVLCQFTTVAAQSGGHCDPDSTLYNEGGDSSWCGGVHDPKDQTMYLHPTDIPKLATVVCGDRLDEALVMIKSALLYDSIPVHFHVFVDDELRQELQDWIGRWPAAVQSRMRLKVHAIQYPGVDNKDEWKKLFAPCASQRLFIPDILSDLDAVIHVDTDVLFMRPPVDLWRHFRLFNSSQVAALVREHEDALLGWYPRFAKVPYYRPSGLNSGVLMMNLSRMREARWGNHVITNYKLYKHKLIWKDQDLINIYFHFFPEHLYVLSCSWNYRSDFCMYGIKCEGLKADGVSVLHGSRGVFHNEKQPAFKAVYRAFSQFAIGGDLEKDLLNPVKLNLMHTLADNPKDACTVSSLVLTNRLQHTVDQCKQHRPHIP